MSARGASAMSVTHPHSYFHEAAKGADNGQMMVA
jgi:hypothetical protein